MASGAGSNFKLVWRKMSSNVLSRRNSRPGGRGGCKSKIFKLQNALLPFRAELTTGGGGGVQIEIFPALNLHLLLSSPTNTTRRMHVNIFRHNLNVAPKTGVANPYRRRKKRGTNSLFLPKRSRRPTKSCGKTIQIYSFISRHGLNVNVAPKTGVAKTYPCHTTFQTGVAAATPATPLPAPLLAPTAIICNIQEDGPGEQRSCRK